MNKKASLFIGYIEGNNDLREKLEYKKKRPHKDGTLEGDLSRW